MKLAPGRVEALVWILIYGGLFAVGIGFALDRAGESYGLGVMGFGMVDIAVGCVLVWVRSRMAAR